MQVKHRLLINLVVAALLVAVILVMLVVTTGRVVRTVETSTIADAIITTAFERLALDSDYINSGNERSRQQVDAKYRQIDDLLKSAAGKFTDPEDQRTLTALIETSESVRAILLSIMAKREHGNPLDRPEALFLAVEERLVSQMTMRIYETVRLGGRLQESSNTALILSLKQAGGGIVAILLFAGVAMVINIVSMNQAISRRMARLRHGATLIGEGSLEHRIEIGGSDEFADLAKAFNAMTEKLRGSYQELEREVEVRRRAEEAVFNDITGRIRAEENLQKAYSELETRVQERTQELQELTETLEDRVTKRTAELRAANETLRTSRLAALNLMEDAVIDRKNLEEITASLRWANADLINLNRELESFVYSASHDLRAPLRHISAFAELVTGRYAGRLDEKGRDYLQRICSSAARMTKTIDELLKLSRISRQDIRWEPVDLSEMAAHIVGRLREADPDRRFEVTIEPDLVVQGDSGLLELSLSNLLRNAWKFTSKTENPQIAFGTVLQNEKRVYSVRDNGVGFDMKIAGKMFRPFHRLHPDSDFEGNGIGLAIVERAIRRHGGKVWAEGEVGKGAAFYFRLED